MRLPQSEIKTESYGVISTTSFGISPEDIGLILNILRTKIYKNPILATCREISCNARDAHREVDGDPNNPTTANTPIEVYLPNSSEPTIKIKDFGPGIGPDRKDIFVKFGASTKRYDDIQTGAFGIGAKSPWSYGQSFTVDTVADAPFCYIKPRIRYVYNAYIDESQVGAMDLMLMEPTDEPNQTSIIIPVKCGDFYKFAETMIECTKHWEVKPKLFGGDPDNRPSYPVFKELYRGTGWVMYTEGVTYPCAIVDGIEYPIDKYSLSGKSDLQRHMLQYGFCMEFGVGELTLTANRDHLHYDDATVKEILEKVDSIAAEIKNKIVASISEAPSYFEACNLYRSIKKQIHGIINNLGKLTWNGHKLRATCNIHDIGRWAKVVGYKANGDQVLVERVNNKIYFNDPKVMLIHNDKTNYLNKHIVLWLLKEHEDIETIQVIYTPDVPSSADFKEAVERYGSGDDETKIEYDTVLLDLLQPTKYSSVQIPKAKYLPKAANGGRALLEGGNINGYDIYSEYVRGYGHKLKGSPAQFPRDEGGVYITYNYKDRTFHSGDKRIRKQSFDIAKEFLGEDIIGLSWKRAEMIADNPNWIPLERALHNLFAPYEQKMSGEDLKALMERARFASGRKLTRFASRLGEIEDRESPLVVWHEKCREVLDEAEEFRPGLGLYRWFGHPVKNLSDYDYTNNADGPIVELYNRINERYPLLDSVSSSTTTVVDSLVEYINLIDKYRSEALMEGLLAELSSSNPNSLPMTGTDSN